MYWTLELASKLEDAPWPATKDELIDYAMRSGAPLEVLENLQEIEDEGDVYESIEDLWPDYPSKYVCYTPHSLRVARRAYSTFVSNLVVP
jgi:hypothetical protein